jgi:hypothetical protein
VGEDHQGDQGPYRTVEAEEEVFCTGKRGGGGKQLNI